MEQSAGASPTGLALERLARNDRIVVLAGIATLTLLSWIYLVRMAAMMSAAASNKAMHAAMGMPEMAAWGAAEFIMLFTMWAVMMVAMMLPSAAPMILLVVGVYRRRADGQGDSAQAGHAPGGRARILTAAFGSGYLLAWTAFSALAAFLQLTLHRAALMSADMATNSAIAGAGILIAGGVYQWLPFKSACLTHCRSPLAFLTEHWREGAAGALTMGLRHGLYCVGCCWALMLLLFAAGVMNLLWVAAIAIYVLIEKLVRGQLIGRLAGAALVVWGSWILLKP